MIGTIARWGYKGFGFVEADGLPAPAWTHADYLEDSSYQPRAGDRVEFELKRLPDGRVQARRVRPVGRNGVATAAPSPRAVGPSSAFGAIGDRLAASQRPAVLPLVATSTPPSVTAGIGQQLADRQRVREQDLARLEGQAATLRGEVAQLQARILDLSAQADRVARDLGQRRSAGIHLASLYQTSRAPRRRSSSRRTS